MRVAFLTAAVALTAAMALSAPAAGAVRTAHSGWVWGSPQPQGQTIRALAFSGGRGYAAGRLGTVLLTDDDGLTWRGASTGTTAELTQLSVPAPGIVVAGGGCEVIRSDDGGSTFQALPWVSSSLACPAPLAALDFVDGQTGYVVLDNGAVRATGDGGFSWDDRMGVPQTVSGSGEPDAPLAADFSGARNGLAVTSGGVVYRTLDGATTWKVVSSGHPSLRTVAWASSTVAYAAGDGGTVLRSLDSGATWSLLPTMPVDVGQIRCAGILDCVAVAVDGRSVLRTRNGGLSYSQTPSGARRLFTATFASDSKLVAAGEAGSTAVSEDGGQTWSRLGNELAMSFSRVRAFDDDFAVAAGRSGALAVSSDAGRTWTAAYSPTEEEVIDVVYRNPSHGLLLDAAGATYRTLDGSAWERLHTGGARYPQAVLAPRHDVVVLVGPKGMWRSTDEGDSFRRVNGRLVRRSKLFGADHAGGRLFAYGSKVMLSSGDGGRRWHKVRMPRKALLAEVDFVTARTGFALGQNGRMWMTRDRGRHWHDLAGIGSDDGIGMSFSDARHGYIVLSRFGDDARGYIIRTSDGGKTWRPQLLTGTPVPPDGVSATDAGIDIALSDGTSLLYTDRGGDAGRRSTVHISGPRSAHRGARVRLAGRVNGAAPGTEVLVSRRQRGESVWDSEVGVVEEDGRFETSFRLQKTASFVAQWPGDEDQAGDGSAPVVVRTRR